MVQKHIVQLIDDIDGSDADETVSFALDGVRYEIDLSDAHAAQLRDALALYVANARRAGTLGGSSGGGRSRGGGGARTDKEQTSAIREWARRNGYEVNERGRIPSAVLDAYNAQH